MNRKTIRDVLIKKHKQWYETIEDKAVRTMVKENTIITGGCIASMLINEKVNDFDCYFRTREVTIAVARYYIAKFMWLHPETKIPPTIWEEDPNRVKIVVKSAGIVSETGKDSQYEYFENFPDEVGMNYVDQMFQGDEQPAEALEEADKSKEKFRPIFMTANAITLSDRMQLIIRFYGEPKDIHDNYDFVHCTNYWDSKDGQLVLQPAALESLLVKHLQYEGSLYPICSVIRTRKFLKKGWHINAGQYLKMLFQVSELDLTDMKVLEDQLTGVDSAYFAQVISYCKERQVADPEFKPTAPYLISIIDKIFG